MSMIEEGTNPSTKPTASDNQERKPSGQNGAPRESATQRGTGLSGLAGFGKMPGYAPVAPQLEPQASEPAAEQAPEQSAAPQEDTEPEYREQDPQQPTGYDPDQYSDTETGDHGSEVNYASAVEAGGRGDHPDYLSGQEAVQEYQTEPVMHGDQDLGDQELHVDPSQFHNEMGLQGDSGRSLQNFEAHYDQHPEIPLGAFEDPAQEQPAQPFFHEQGQAGDAEFLGAGAAQEVAEPKERRGRKILMASSGLIGVLALGGALAFAYKIGGDSDIASAGKPPLIQADNRPVKLAPEKPGGKQFPHKNKKIYERLGGSDTKEVERIVPRQEDVAAAATAAISGARPAAPVPGAPRKVKTLTVRPDGTMEVSNPRQKIVKAPAAPAASAVSNSGGTGIAMTFPQAAASAPPPAATAPATAAQAPVKPDIPKPAAVAPPPAAPAQAGAAQTSAVAAPVPVQKPSAPRAAAAAPVQVASRPATAPAAAAREYTVQVAARKSQTEALATFADIQQKYPRLLSGYRPIIKRADLGSKGVWYRLNVGPIESKKVASALCGQLKSAGMRSCLVRAQ